MCELFGRLQRCSAMRFKHDPVRSEFTAPHIRLEDYVLRPEWIALPIPIKVALIHLWRAEQQSEPLTVEANSDLIAKVGAPGSRDVGGGVVLANGETKFPTGQLANLPIADDSAAR